MFLNLTDGHMKRIALFDPEVETLNFGCRACRPVVWNGRYNIDTICIMLHQCMTFMFRSGKSSLQVPIIAFVYIKQNYSDFDGVFLST